MTESLHKQVPEPATPTITMSPAAVKAFEAALAEAAGDSLHLQIDEQFRPDLFFAPREPADVDRPGMRVAVGENSAYDLFLTRTLKNATLLRTAGGCCKNLDLFRTEKLDAAAGVRQPLAEYAKQHDDVRVMEQPFQQIRQAMATPKGRPAAAAYLKTFIEEMKASGFVADALKRSNQPDAAVAPPATD